MLLHFESEYFYEGVRMKKAVQVLSVLSALSLFVGCSGGGGGSNSSPVAAAGTSAATGISNGLCSEAVVRHYKSIKTYGLSNTNLAYDCSQLSSLVQNQSCTYTEYNIVSTVSYAEVQSVCAQANNPNYPNQPGNPNQPVNPINQPISGKRNFKCQLSMKSGNSYGDTGVMNVALDPQGGQAELFTNILRTKKLFGPFYVNTMTNSSRKVGVSLVYKSAVGVSAETLELRVTGLDNQLTTTMMGSAARKVSLEIEPNEYRGSTLSVSCENADGVRPEPVINGNTYTCKGRQKIDSDKLVIKTRNQLSDLMDAGLVLAKDVYLESDITSSTVQMISEVGTYKVTAVSSLTSPIIFAVQDSSSDYSLSGNCKITP